MIFKIINFLIFAGILIYFLRKPIREFWEARHKEIGDSIFQVGAMHERLFSQEAGVELKMRNLDKERAELIEELKKEGRIEERRIIEDAKKYALRLKSDCGRAIQYETDSALKDIRVKVVEMAINLAAKKIVDKTSADGQTKMAEVAALNIVETL